MALIRFDPWEDLLQVQREMAHLLHEPFTRLAGALQLGEYPPLNITETDDAVRITAELPGVAGKDVDITVTGDILVLKGVKEIQKGSYGHRERRTGPFSRSVHLPGHIDRDALKATLSDGLLVITLPKSMVARKRKITIESKG
ncbi:MAG: Hsp20/alpha crystallin family protein [Planctomycetota bacterium]